MVLSPADNWGYYKQIDIADAGADSSQYQMKLTIYSGDGADNTVTGEIYCDGKSQDFSDDIRFGTTDDPDTATQLNHWIEEEDAAHIVVWVKCPTDGSNTFYLFTGRVTTDVYNNGDATFIFFDDFETDFSKWTTEGAPEISTNQNYEAFGNLSCRINIEDNRERILRTHGSKLSEVAVEISYYDEGIVDTDDVNMLIVDDTTNLLAIGIYGTLGGGTTKYTWREGAAFKDTGIARTTEWHKAIFDFSNTTTCRLTWDGNLIGNVAEPDTWDRLVLGQSWAGKDGVNYIDTVFVRKATATPPTFDTFGGWQSLDNFKVTAKQTNEQNLIGKQTNEQNLDGVSTQK